LKLGIKVKKQPVFPGCLLALTLKEAPMEVGFGRMRKLVWFFHEKDSVF
jgi:hypothetical protein